MYAAPCRRIEMAKLKYKDFDLPVTVAGVRFRNPFFVASGPTTMTIDQIRRINETGWGGASLKLTVDPPPYINRRPRYGYYNKEEYLAFTAEKRLTLDELLRLIEQSRRDAPDLVLFSNITYSGGDLDGWVSMAKQCEDAGVHITEINACCPNMSFNVELSGDEACDGPRTGASMACSEDALTPIVEAIKAETSIPVFVKLSPEGGRLRYVAKAVIDAGAAAVGSAANRVGITPLDLDHPEASTNFLQEELGLSCLSGRWILPLGKRDAYEIRRMVGPDAVVTATGGVTEWQDAVEMAMCGADLVGMCTATLEKGFGFMPEFIHHVKEFMKEKGYKEFRDMRDLVVGSIKSAPELTIYEGIASVIETNLAAPCDMACSAHVPAQAYVRAVAEGDLELAYNMITSKNPFQSICGKICDHPCETVCTRATKDEPLRIRDIKDFVLTYAKEQGWTPNVEKAPRRRERVAVVGAGPAGLSAAYDLARAGYNVTVYEKEKDVGGALRAFIPPFRMDQEELDEETASVRALGVEIKTNVAFGKDITIESLKEEGNAAIFIAIGAWACTMPDIPGENADGCIAGIEFLSPNAKSKLSLAGQRVAVIGGGFTALDAARTSIRMGAEDVYILYRRTKVEMPAAPDEILEAEEEGVQIMYLVAPKEVLTDGGKVTGLRLVNLVLGETDDSGRRRPELVEGSEFTLKLDKVVFAISQIVETDGVPAVDTAKNGFIKVDSEICRTSMPGVYAGGDCVGGPIDVIAAIADGKRAAAYIDRELAGDQAFLKPEPQLHPVQVDDVLEREGEDPRRWRVPVQRRPAGERRKDWDLFRKPLTLEEAVAEAQRCYGCGCGSGCDICVELCSAFVFGYDGPRIRGDYNKCTACGMCIWRCPNHNITMVQTSEKPI